MPITKWMAGHEIRVARVENREKTHNNRGHLATLNVTQSNERTPNVKIQLRATAFPNFQLLIYVQKRGKSNVYSAE
jgi:hypothetical protein